MGVEGIELTWWELTGLLGASIYATSYLAIAFGHLTSESRHYYLLQMCAACAVLLSLTHSFNLASVIIQVFFITVSIIGFLRRTGTKGSVSVGMAEESAERAPPRLVRHR